MQLPFLILQMRRILILYRYHKAIPFQYLYFDTSSTLLSPFIVAVFSDNFRINIYVPTIHPSDWLLLHRI